MPKKIGKRSALKNGEGLRFEVASTGPSDRCRKGFVVEFAGRAYAYENRCPHLGIELDWAPGQFFDPDGAYLICSTHGAIFEPDTGKCVGGPCVGQSLTRMPLEEKEGELFAQIG